MDKLKQLVVDEFSSSNAQNMYIKKAEEGLWKSEETLINRYFTKKKSKILDIGCGTGRTTISLYKKGYNVIGIDITPKMIINAKLIAKKKGLKINYIVGDATQLKFNSNSFDYALFSNQGWTQIPQSSERLKALNEIYRVLKKNGVFVFTIHPRKWFTKNFFFWLLKYFKFYFLKPLGFHIQEFDFGDRFFTRESIDNKPSTKQYIHIPDAGFVIQQIEKSGFKLIHTSFEFGEDLKSRPRFFVCQK